MAEAERHSIPNNLAVCHRNGVARNDPWRIVGGTTIEPNSWFWLAQLRRNGNFICGANILSDNWLLSAGHCCASSWGYSVVIGAHARAETDNVYAITERIRHPNYGAQNGINNDFCLLRTTQSMDLGIKTLAQIVCLPNQNDHIPAGTENCFVGGWGALQYAGKNPDFAQSVAVNIYSETECRAQSLYGSNTVDFDTEFCAGDFAGGTDSCQGDSGGPLICIVNNRPYLYGVVSWGQGCAWQGYPGVYAKVSSAVDWIVSTTGGDGVFADEMNHTTTTEPYTHTGTTTVTFTATTPSYTTTATTPTGTTVEIICPSSGSFPVSEKQCPDFKACLGNEVPGIVQKGDGLTDGNLQGSSTQVQCSDNFFDGNDGRTATYKVTCGCNSSKGCRWVWKDNRIRQCLPKDTCVGLDKVVWGGFVGNRIVGHNGVHFNARFYHMSTADGTLPNYSDGWTIFLLINRQITSSIGNLTLSATSLEAQLVGTQKENDCSSTVFQFQSTDFHGHDSFTVKSNVLHNKVI